MSLRELVVLGTASQVPTRQRNHNGCFLRWDEDGLLLDPGEGTQRQLTLAGIPVSAITKIFITHFHGDHSLGLASIVQRLSLDRVPHPVEVFYPESGEVYYERLVSATIYHRVATLVPRPLAVGGAVVDTSGRLRVEALPLEHPVDTLGYRVSEPDGRRFLPEKLRARGIAGPAVGELERYGRLEIDGQFVSVADVSIPQPGGVFAFVMDTRPTVNAGRLAEGADLLVCESTYLEVDAELAHAHYHMTAGQAADLARRAGARSLVLTHFSQRYRDAEPFRHEADAIFPGTQVAKDLGHYPFPRPDPERSG